MTIDIEMHSRKPSKMLGKKIATKLKLYITVEVMMMRTIKNPAF